MSIIATNQGSAQRELAPAGTHMARCYSMVHIGTVKEEIMGKTKRLNKVRLSWELPEEKRIFNEEKGEQPITVSKEFNLSLYPGSTLRSFLDTWRGKALSEEEAEKFDVTRLLSIPCLLTIIHKPSKKNPSLLYEEISGVAPLMKSQICPPQINKSFEFNYAEKWDWDVFNYFPDFIKDKMKASEEYAALNQQIPDPASKEKIGDDLPF